MNFKPELAAKVMSGEKTVTRRLVSDNPNSPWWQAACSLKVGQDYAVCPGRGKNQIGRVRVKSVSLESLAEFGGDDEARREGFSSWEEFRDVWVSINKGYDSAALVWRIWFEVVEVVGDDRRLAA